MQLMEAWSFEKGLRCWMYLGLLQIFYWVGFNPLGAVVINHGNHQACYIMRSWLQEFAFRMSINWVVFVIAGLIAVGIAFVTIQFHVLKAICAKPIKSLQTEW